MTTTEFELIPLYGCKLGQISFLRKLRNLLPLNRFRGNRLATADIETTLGPQAVLWPYTCTPVTINP